MPDQVCILCGATYTAPAHLQGYQGLCNLCWSKDTLREWDRIESARKHLQPGTPDTLRLDEWLAVIAASRGVCLLCETVQFSILELWTPAAGLTVSNAVPLCRACSIHHRGSWAAAINRVSLLLADVSCSNSSEMIA